MIEQMVKAFKFRDQIDGLVIAMKELKDIDPDDEFYSGWLVYMLEVIDNDLGEAELRHVADLINERLMNGRW